MKKSLILLFVVAILVAVGASTALAGDRTLEGTLTPGDPTMPVVFISAPNCTGQGASAVMYHAIEFTVDSDGVYNFSLTSDGGFASLYLMDAGFNPPAAFPNCLAGDNSGNPVTFSVALTAGVTYYAIPFDDTFAQLGGNYSLFIDGPGNIILPGDVASCPYPLPSGAVVRSVPAGAPTFFAPDLGSQINDLTLPAGTWYVSAYEGDFALVWIACQAQPIYIPANAIAP